MSGGLYLEDLYVGQRFESPKHLVTAEAVKRFAAEFDPQPFHLDDAVAKGSLFGGLVASGWHTGSLTMRMLVEGGAPIANGVIGAGVDVSWPRPTYPGDELQVVSEVMEITPSRSKPDRGIVILKSETRNQRGEVVLALTSKLVVPRRPASPGAT